MTWKWVRDRRYGPFHAVSEDADTTVTMFAVCLEKISPGDLQVHVHGEKIARGGQCGFCARLTLQLAQADRAGDIPDGRPTPEQLRAEYERGESIQGLAVRHRMATKTVRARLVRAGAAVRFPATHPGEEDRVAHNRDVLGVLARQPGQELTCAEIAEQLGEDYDVIYRTLQRLTRDELVTSREPDPHENRGRRPFRLTPAGIVHTRQTQPNPDASGPPPPVSAVWE